MSVSGECCVCCQVDVSAMGRSLVQRSPTQYGVYECDLHTSTLRLSSHKKKEIMYPYFRSAYRTSDIFGDENLFCSVVGYGLMQICG